MKPEKVHGGWGLRRLSGCEGMNLPEADEKGHVEWFLGFVDFLRGEMWINNKLNVGKI